jgi:hypothetical protein
MSELITLGLYALATARAVRLIKDDKITAGLRARILRQRPNNSLLRYLFECDWCVSIWAAAPFAAAYTLAPHHRATLAVVTLLALSWLAVIAADVQRLVNGKATLYNQPMPAPDKQEAQR